MAFTEIECSDPDEFWDLLDPRNPLKLGLESQKTEKLLYRGQANYDWPLLPSAFREYELTNNIYVSKYTADAQITSEFMDLKEFITNPEFNSSIHDTISSINEDKLFNESIFKEKFRYNLNSWPSEEYFPFLALAQHHTIKTQLLDWSSYAYISAYFATSPYIDKKNIAQKFAIWVYLPDNNSKILIRKVPISSDGNMNAQKGYFTCVKQQMIQNKPFTITTIDNLSTNNLWKITLSSDFFPHILTYCRKHQIDASSIYKSKGFDSIAKANYERKICETLMGKKQTVSLFADYSELS